MPEDIDLDVFWPSGTELSAWQSEWIGRNQQERSQAETEIGIETISRDSSAPSDLVRLRIVRYYASVGSFSTAIFAMGL